MALEPIQQVAILIAGSMLVFALAVQFSPGGHGRKPLGAWSRVANEGGLAVLAGGFVALLSLAAGSLLPRLGFAGPALPRDHLEPFSLICVIATLLLLCCERGRWTGHQPATVLAALVPWLLVPEWTGADQAVLPAEQLGLVSAALYRVALSGGRSAHLETSARHAAVEAISGSGLQTAAGAAARI